MGKKIVSGTMLTLLSISMVTLAFNIQLVKASGTIIIRADGSVDPDTAPISSVDNVTYTFADNIYEGIYVHRSNIVIDGNGYTLQGSGSGYGFALCSKVTIKRTKIKGFEVGIYLGWGSSYNTICGNNITDNECGIFGEWYSHSITISGNSITNNGHGILFMRDSPYNSIVGNSITNNGYGISFGSYSFSNTISGNNVTSNGCGIWLPRESFNNTISGNNVTSNGRGIWVNDFSFSNTISGNSITQNNQYGIGLGQCSSSNTICGNSITSNGYGIWGALMGNPIGNTISGNNITSNGCGIWLEDPYKNTFSGNSITSNGCGIWLLGFSSSNTISGNSITQNNQYGIGLELDSRNNTICGNNITDNECGILLSDRCYNNTISGNSITQNTEYGIRLFGLFYEGPWANTISGNNVANNGYGIWLGYSYNNTVYHNNLVDNTKQVYSDGSTNVWDDGYPSGGNYWNDYSIRYPTVVDDYHGENQDISSGDGIWDSPYFIDAGNKDNYPFVNSWFLDMIPPVADAGPDQIVHEDTPVILNGEASSDNVGIVSYVWTFTDVNPQTLTGVNPTYTFQTPGIYTVTLNVTDAAGNWATDTVIITVLLDVTSPVADAGPDQTIDEDTLVTLEGWRSTDNVGVISWTWTFTDVTPQTLTGENVTYTFTTPGIYTVTLEVSDAAGNHATDTVTITVLSLTPEELLQRLMETIESWNLGRGIENSLTSKLEDALHLVDTGNENGAIHKLMDFINQVEASRGKKLTIEQADYLTAEAQRIIDLIRG